MLWDPVHVFDGNEHVRKIVTMGHDNTSSSKKELKSSNYLV